MQSKPPSNQAHGISRFVNHALTTITQDALPVIVVVAEEREDSEIDELLSTPGVAGVVVTAAACSHVGDGARVGVIGDDGNWRMPETRARSLLMLTGGRLLNLKRSLRAWRRGIRYVITLHNLEKLNQVRLGAWMIQRLTMLLGSNMLQALNQRLPVSASMYERRIATRLNDLLRDRTPAPMGHFVPGRVVLANNSLAAGGAERQLVNTALALKQEGRDVSILCNQLGSAEFDFYRNRVASSLPVRRVQSLLDIIATLEPNQSEALGALLRASRLTHLTAALPTWVVDDVVLQAANLLVRRPAVVHFWQDYTSVVGGLAAVLVGVPRVVLGFRNMAPFRFPYFYPFMGPVYRALAACPSVEMVNNSRAGGLDYARWLGIEPAERIRVVLNGVAGFKRPSANEVTAWRSGVGLPSGCPVVGSIYRFWPEKDPMLWLEAAAEVAARYADVVFLLIGAGPMQSDIEQRAQRLGINGRLFLPGTLEDVRVAVAAMDVFLMTSRVEGTPNVLIEAQYLGCPVVTTVAGGSAETVDHGATGWVVPERDPRALADCVLRVLHDEAWRKKARASAPLLTRGRFGIEKMVKETKQIYGL